MLALYVGRCRAVRTKRLATRLGGQAARTADGPVPRPARAASGGPLDLFWSATVCGALNDREGVFRWLEAALEQHAGLIFMMRRHPAFERYRADPRFQAIMRKVYGV